jgi:hypothetical protein
VRCYFAFGELAHGAAKLLLFVGERKIHGASIDLVRMGGYSV